MGRRTALALALWLAAGLAAAQMPEATIQKIAGLEVHLVKVGYLFQTKQITRSAYAEGERTTRAQINALWTPYRTLPAAEQRTALNEIHSRVTGRLVLLRPEWERKAREVAQKRQSRDTTLRASAVEDARRALTYQRQRLKLQNERKHGTITSAEFHTEDQRAMDAIKKIRAPLAAAGPTYARIFDRKLARLTSGLASNPSTPLPTPQVRPGHEGGTTAADYRKDVALAASITRKEKALYRRYDDKKISGATFRETDIVYNHDLSRLYAKWQHVSPQKGAEFQRDVATYRPPGHAVHREAGATTTVHAASPTPENASGASSSAWPYILVLLFVGGGVVYLFTRRKSENFVPSPPVSKNYGSAAWSQVKLDAASRRAAQEGVFLGKMDEPGAPNAEPVPLHFLKGAPAFTTPEHHTLVVARTRTGKGTRVIIPTLLRYDGSVLAIDPKGENAAVTARVRRGQLGQQIHIINPWNELSHVFPRLGFEPAAFNPLDILDRTDLNSVGIAQSFAGAICPTSPNDKDRFWQGSAANVLTAVLLWVTDRPEEEKTLEHVREIITLSRSDFTKNYMTRMAASTAFRGAIREMISPYLDLAEETYSGVMANLSESTRFLSDPMIKVATATSSFSMVDLIEGRATVYLVIPPDRIDAQRTWLRLVITAAMHAFKRTPHHTRPGHRCQFLIDEFPALGFMADLPRNIATMSGFGVDFTLVIQGLDQLKAIYGDSAPTILSNCGYKWFCNISDLESAKYLSESLGRRTVRTTTRSVSTKPGQGGAPESSESVSHGEMGRALLNPDEIMNLGRDVAVALQPNGKPLYLRPVDYWRLDEAFHRLQEKHPELFWDPPLAADPNPYVRAGG